jgi:hypothetical protein
MIVQGGGSTSCKPDKRKLNKYEMQARQKRKCLESETKGYNFRRNLSFIEGFCERNPQCSGLNPLSISSQWLCNVVIPESAKVGEVS